ncbi:GSCOCG00009246001-RA-CDS, partial [Cotesia congregata]
VIRCFKCWGINHIANRCKNEEKCRKCANNHHENACSSTTTNCVNC